uniref:Uracil-DNA glycosylase-like domain-containing protein n=1 Tax=viral metagenome TaxID=1070528 RepID=A0A6C0BDL2_9ZZZZ
MSDIQEEAKKSEFQIPMLMTKYKTFKEYESTLPPLVTSLENIMQNLNISNMGLNICKPSAELFSISNRIPYDINNFICPKGWENILNTPEARSELARVFSKLQTKVGFGETIFPKEELIFRAFNECPLHKLKVVIIGQDPYHKIDSKLGVEMASGLAFSGIFDGEKPSSMIKIFKELERTFPEIQLEHYDLTSWARQGVLLLNTALTVRMGQANSHGKEKIWKYYIEYVIKRISEDYPGVVFLLWGSHAKELRDRSDPVISPKAIVLKCGHPSGINTSKNPESMFDNNGHFSSIWYYINSKNIEILKKNELLQRNGNQLIPYIDQINWSLTRDSYYRMKQEENEIYQAIPPESLTTGTHISNVNINQQLTNDNQQIQSNHHVETQKIGYTEEQIQQLMSQGYTRKQIEDYQNECINRYYQDIQKNQTQNTTALYLQHQQKEQKEYNPAWM